MKRASGVLVVTAGTKNKGQVRDITVKIELHVRRSRALSALRDTRLSSLPGWPCRFDPGHPLGRDERPPAPSGASRHVRPGMQPGIGRRSAATTDPVTRSEQGLPQDRGPSRHNACRRMRRPAEERQRRRSSSSIPAGHVHVAGGRGSSERDPQGAAPVVRTGDSPGRTDSFTHRPSPSRITLGSGGLQVGCRSCSRTTNSGQPGCQHGLGPPRRPRVPVLS